MATESRRTGGSTTSCPHPPRRNPRRAHGPRRTNRPGSTVALPGTRSRRSSGVGHDVHGPPRPRTLAVLVRRPPRRRHRPGGPPPGRQPTRRRRLARARAGMFPDRPMPPVAPSPARQPGRRRWTRRSNGTPGSAPPCWGPAGARVRDWLHGRGFDDATIRANLLGCDPGRRPDAPPPRTPLRQGPRGDVPGVRPGRTGQLRPSPLPRRRRRRPQVRQPILRARPHPRIAFTVASAGAALAAADRVRRDARRAHRRPGRLPSIALLGAQSPDATVAARVASYAEHHRPRRRADVRRQRRRAHRRGPPRRPAPRRIRRPRDRRTARRPHRRRRRTRRRPQRLGTARPGLG